MFIKAADKGFIHIEHYQNSFKKNYNNQNNLSQNQKSAIGTANESKA